MINEIIILILMFIGLLMPILSVKFKLKGLQICVIFLTILTTIFTGMFVEAFGLTISLGVPFFGAIFLSTDLIGEIYGKKKGFETIFLSFISNLFLLIIGFLSTLVIPMENQGISNALMTLFTFIPQVLLGGLIAFLVSQNLDVFLFAKIKKITNKKYLWIRNCFSTIISQAIDTFLVVFIGFWSLMPANVLVDLFVSTYILKVIIALIDTPFCYLGRKFFEEV